MYLDSSIIVARWPIKDRVRLNWGDRLNGELIHRLSHSPVVNAEHVQGWENRPVYRVIGSGMGGMRTNEIVWGMGFIKHDAEMAAVPEKICAVRGPKTRARLLELGVGCPEIYGDPAILYPLFYYPKVEQTHDVGIIQHFRETDSITPSILPEGTSVKMIDICGGLQNVVRDVLSCRRIISSSLHGVICAHAYGIEASWYRASDLPLGDGFKFEDYYASIGYDELPEPRLDDAGKFDAMGQPTLPGDMLIDPEKLLNACPFISTSRRKELIKAVRRGAAAGRPGLIFRTPPQPPQAAHEPQPLQVTDKPLPEPPAPPPEPPIQQ